MLFSDSNKRSYGIHYFKVLVQIHYPRPQGSPFLSKGRHFRVTFYEWRKNLPLFATIWVCYKLVRLVRAQNFKQHSTYEPADFRHNNSAHSNLLQLISLHFSVCKLNITQITFFAHQVSPHCCWLKIASPPITNHWQIRFFPEMPFLGSPKVFSVLAVFSWFSSAGTLIGAFRVRGAATLLLWSAAYISYADRDPALRVERYQSSTICEPTGRSN